MIVGFSTLVSLWRGFVKEALSLTAWVAAFVVAAMMTDRLALMLADYVSNPTGRFILAYILLFVATLVLGALLNSMAAQVIQATGLGGLDRLLGTAFGLVRGLIVIVVITFVARELAPAESERTIRESQLMPYVNVVVDRAREWFDEIPSDLKPQLPTASVSTAGY